MICGGLRSFVVKWRGLGDWGWCRAVVERYGGVIRLCGWLEGLKPRKDLKPSGFKVARSGYIELYTRWTQ